MSIIIVSLLHVRKIEPSFFRIQIAPGGSTNSTVNRGLREPISDPWPMDQFFVVRRTAVLILNQGRRAERFPSYLYMKYSEDLLGFLFLIPARRGECLNRVITIENRLTAVYCSSRSPHVAPLLCQSPTSAVRLRALAHHHSLTTPDCLTLIIIMMSTAGHDALCLSHLSCS